MLESERQPFHQSRLAQTLLACVVVPGLIGLGSLGGWAYSNISDSLRQIEGSIRKSALATIQLHDGSSLNDEETLRYLRELVATVDSAPPDLEMDVSSSPLDSAGRVFRPVSTGPQ